MNILFDTNVLIAGLITRGVCSNLLDHCLRVHTVFTSEFIVQELREHLTGKFKYDITDADAAINLLLEKMMLVAPNSFPVSVCRDPSDDAILAAALAGKCVCVITGDKDLLTLERFQAIDILSPSAFWAYEKLYQS